MNIELNDPRKKYFPGVVQQALLTKLVTRGFLRVEEIHGAYTIGKQGTQFIKKLTTFGIARQKNLGIYTYIPINPAINDSHGEVQVTESKP